MAADPIGPLRAGKLDGDGPGHGRVIPLTLPLAGRRTPAAPAGPAACVQDGAAATVLRFGLHFTAADHDAMAAWAGDIGHGYDRLHVERGVLEDGGWASYALIYMPGQAWSTWGVTRRDGRVEVWRCATGKTMGRHARMADALASLPHAAEHRQTLPAGAGRAGGSVSSRRHGTR